MSWLNGDKLDAVAPRFKRRPGLWNKLRDTVGRTSVMYKTRTQVRYKFMREHFEGLRDDMRPIEFINVEMIKHYLREPWSMPK
jgi:hypothetical protein